MTAETRPYGEIMDEMDHEAKYLPAENILADIIVTMRHARVFITSREKMHPTGIALYDELLEKLERRRLGPVPVNAFSGDHEDERAIKLHFNRKVTDEDRKWLLDAINAWWPGEEFFERRNGAGP